jgi:cytochrome c oxidase subunit 4
MPDVKTYLGVFVGLLGLTAFTVYSALNWHFKLWGIDLNVLLAIFIACTKAGLVIAYFMNLKNSERLAQIWAAAGLFFLLIMFVFGMSDFVSRYFTVDGW